MSTRDTMTPFLSTPWVDARGRALSVRALPGLRPELIKTLQSGFPGMVNPSVRALLATCCGLTNTELGLIDFTGCCFPEEPCDVFQPCMTLAIDDAGRRWIAELGDEDLPGPVWCVLPLPQVAVHISDDLASFIAVLHDHARDDRTLAWLQDLTATADEVWVHRRALALRPSQVCRTDETIRTWLSCLPSDAYVYDLRESSVRAWPYGAAGPSGRLYRCGRLPVFAVAGAPAEGRRVGRPDVTAPTEPIAALSLDIAAIEVPTSRRRTRAKPSPSRAWRSRRVGHPARRDSFDRVVSPMIVAS